MDYRKVYKPKTMPVEIIDDKKGVYDSADGTQTISPRFRRSDLNPKYSDFIIEAIGNTITFYDWEVPADLIYLQWLDYYTDLNVHEFEDYMEFSIIDKNDVTGLFVYYGLTVGEDILEISKNAFTLYPMKNEHFNFNNDEIVKLLEGLFLRISYTNLGSETVKTRIRMLSHYTLDNLIY